jgi:hypothetical protein
MAATRIAGGMMAFLPGEDNAGNADCLAFNFPAGFLFLVALDFENTAVVTARAFGSKMPIAFLGAVGMRAHHQDGGT